MQKKLELEIFQGPMELLLALVQAEEISLTRIKLVEIIGQVIKGFSAEDDLNDNGDVILIISTLMELKSKLVLPGKVDLQKEISALKEDLLEKLLVHRRLSQVLDALDARFRRRGSMFGRPGIKGEREEVLIPIESQDCEILHLLAKGIKDSVRQDSFRMDYRILPIEHYLKWIADTAKGRDFSFFELAKKRHDLLDISGVMVALLEMVRLGSLEMKSGRLREDVFFSWTKNAA